MVGIFEISHLIRITKKIEYVNNRVNNEWSKHREEEGSTKQDTGILTACLETINVGDTIIAQIAMGYPHERSFLKPCKRQATMSSGPQWTQNTMLRKRFSDPSPRKNIYI